jgi:signal transduction histidine kinase
MNWMSYHIGEEFLIAVVCAAIALRVFASPSRTEGLSEELRARLFLIGAGFVLLGLNSAVHAAIHFYGLNENLLYQTLLGYCLGLGSLIMGVSSERPEGKMFFPLLYLPLLVFLHPAVYSSFPIFGQFRPLVWVMVAYLSGTVCILYMAVYYRTRARSYIFSSMGHALICTSAIFLFFPAAIGSKPWLYGHLLRPLGFVVLFFSMNREDVRKLKGSLLYKALAAFSLLAAVPLLVFGTVVFYENVRPLQLDRRLMVFVLLLVTLASALLFGLGMIIRLIRPVLALKDSVGSLARRGFQGEAITLKSNDEIGELAGAYNEMVAKLRSALAEQDRLSRLAATGELAATLAHEIRNPLNAISGAASYIGDNYRGSLIREFVRIIQAEAGRINRLASSLLNFARPSRPEPTEADLNGLVRETLALLKQDLQEQGVKLQLHLEPHLPPLRFDYHQVKQVLLNLLINALDAVEPGSGALQISTRALNGNVHLSVRDNGRGISPQDMPHIFNPFFTTKTRGTGLGLAISKKIARQHGGDLLAQSRPGRGSTFTLVLPARA